MVKRCKIIMYALVLLLMITHTIKSAELDRQPYSLLAAGVLPIMYNEDNSKIIAILGRQTGIDRINMGTYDYFGGLADLEDENNSVLTAAREWHEEARLEKILGWSIEQTKKFIQNNIKGYLILATHYPDKNTYGVMYMVNIGKDIRDRLFNSFYSSYQEILTNKKDNEDINSLIEKDKLIELNWNNLLQSILPIRNPSDYQSLISVSKSEGSYEDRSLQVRPILRVLLLGITNDNKYKESPEIENDLPLGIFIFATKEVTLPNKKKEYQLSSLSANDKNTLNQMVIDGLGLSKSKRVKKAAALRITKKNELEEPVTQQVVQKNISEQKAPNPVSLSFASKAIFATILAQKSKPTSPISSISPLPKDKQANKPKKDESSSDLLASIGKIFAKGFEIVVNAFSEALNFISSFFKGRA